MIASGGVGGVHPGGDGRPRQVSPITKCAGCAAKAMDAVRTIGDLVSFVVDGEATMTEIARRMSICQACDAVDSSGERLYREADGRPTCGKPRLEELLRDSRVDGCGCYLDDKWKGRTQECPLGKWKLNG